MKTILHYVKATITGGLLFLIPIVLIIIVVGKAFRLLEPLLEKAVVWLHIETFVGVTFLTVLTALTLCLIAFIAGVMIRMDKVKRLAIAVEELILKFLPGFAYLKAIAGEQDSTESRSKWNAVLLEDGDAWVIAFIVEQDANGYSTVFIPESPRADSGNSKIMLTSSLHYHSMSTRDALNSLRHYGAGVLPLLNEKKVI
jgi:uncharacterized membrane protein